MNTTDFEINGSTLDDDYKAILLKSIKLRYLVLKIMGIWIMAGAGISGFNIIRSYFTDENYRDGLFQNQTIRFIAMGFSALFVFAVISAGFKLFNLAMKIQRAVENNQFIWWTGQLTNKECVVRRHSSSSSYLYIDGERCTPVNLTYDEFQATVLGDRYIAVKLPKHALSFAIKI